MLDFLSRIEYCIPFIPHKKNEKKEVGDFPHVKHSSATNEKLYLTHAKKLQIFNLGRGGGGGVGLKICFEGNFVTSAKVAWENRFKIISNHYLNSNV